jgi:ubiquinone/menaquinone biosynthesis C-methylase UbiE
MVRPQLGNHPRLLTDILQWDIHTWEVALRLWEKHLPGKLEGQKTLELGAAHGGPSLWLALKGAEVICSDVYCPGAAARALHQKYAVESRIRYAAIDAQRLPFSDQSLDIVCCKSVLGGISKHVISDPKPQIIAEIYRVLKPGGWFLSADNLYASVMHAHLRKHFISWSKGWEYFSPEALLTLLNAFDTVNYTTAGITALLGRSPQQRQWLSAFDQQVQKLLPPSHKQRWHYVMATASQK